MTKLTLANSENSGWSKISLFNRLHQMHQSEPAKSSITNLFSALALAIATLISVNHSTSGAKMGCGARANPRRTGSQLLIFIDVTAALNDTCPKTGHRPMERVRNGPHVSALCPWSGIHASAGGSQDADPQKTRKKGLQPGFGLLPFPFLLKGN